jgi:PAT family beta-lactamase induction signal transducer AmpG
MTSTILKYKTFISRSLFHDSRLLHIFLFGIISGMPFAILASLVPLWAQDYNMPIALITTYGIARSPYSLKFLWSPIIDGIRLPILYNILGKRLSWMALTIFININILLMLANLNPVESSGVLKIFLIMFGVSAATYDISYDAMRIDMLDDEQQSMGVAVTSFGFRIGVLLAYSGALISAELLGWNITFNLLAAVFFIGLLATITLRKKYFFQNIQTNNLKERFQIYCLEPFKDFFTQKNALLILLTIVLYKLGEAMLAQIMSLFYSNIGFSKIQIATTVKLFAFIATTLGGFIGAYLISKMKLFRGLIVCDILQASTNLFYIWLHHFPTVFVLATTVFTDSFTGAMGSVALGSFLTSLCNKKYSATHFAMLSSLAAFANSVLTTQAGRIVEMLGWDYFFILTFVLAIPGIILVAFLNYKRNK